MREPRSILITGGSSGIGEALARAYAKPGINLAINGRDATRLTNVAAACRRNGAEVCAETADVTDSARLACWIEAADRRAPLDLVIANAGISAGSGGDGESEEQARRILAVNLDGVVNTIHPAIEFMRSRPASDGIRGQIALMSSLAAFRGFPGAPAYCASKAAVKIYGEALRGWLSDFDIAVTVICPGYVRSRITAVNQFYMPMLMDSERAAIIINAA